MKKHKNTLTGLLLTGVLLLTGGCGTTVSDSNTEQPATAERIATQSTEATVTSEATTTESSHTAVQTATPDDLQIQIRDYEKTFQRHNFYTNEVEYAYEVEQVNVYWEETSFKNNYNFHLKFTGKKTYDVHGAEAARPVQAVIRLLDEEENVIESMTLYSKSKLREGDSFDEEFQQSDFDLNMDVEPGNYTIELFSEDKNTVQLAKEDTNAPLAERSYCPCPIVSQNEKNAQLPYDLDASNWVYDFMQKDVHISDGVLTGLFEKDLDLSQLECTESENDNEYISPKDVFYRPTQRYDIDNPSDYLTGVPEEAIPDLIRISYSPDGDMLVSERPCIVVAFCYKHQPEDETAYVSLVLRYFLGNTLEKEEWDSFQKMVKESGADIADFV